MQRRNRRPGPNAPGVAMAAGRGQRSGWKKGTVTGRGQGPTGVLNPFRVCGMQLPSLSLVNEATDCSFWGSFPKVCHEKDARC